ncbi:hypothetical protein D3C81_998780 [compost metagenome]
MHAATRQQGRVQFEGRVFGGRTDKDDRAALDVRQEGILLRLVEAVYFVHEQHRATAVGETLCGGGQHLAHFRQAGEHGGNGLELGVGVLRQQQRKRGFATTRRPPQDHRMHMAGFNRAPQGRVGSQQALLAHHFVQRAGAHALGERAHAFPVDTQQVGRGVVYEDVSGSGHVGILTRVIRCSTRELECLIPSPHPNPSSAWGRGALS